MSRPYACLRQLVAPTNYLVAPRNHLPFRTNVRLRIESADEISSARHAENPDVVGGHAGRKGKRAGQTPVILRLTACRGRISKRDFVSNGRTGANPYKDAKRAFGDGTGQMRGLCVECK